MTLINKLAEERRGRLAAERLLELKQAELYAANRKLGLHARALSNKIVATEAEVENVRGENERIKSDLTVATQKMEIAERRLWHSIETVQDGFAIFDADDQLIVANPAYLSSFEDLEEIQPGIAYARILQIMTEEGIVDPGDRTGAEWREMMITARQSDQPEPVIIRLWNGLYIKLVDRRSPSGDLVSLALNITSSVRYEKQLKAAQKRAEEAARAKSAFLANMSHEIRTPMNGVVGMAEILEDSGLNEDQLLFARTIKSSGEALLSIINDILDYSKMDADKLRLRVEPFDLEKCLHDVVMLLQPSAQEKGVSLLIDYDMFLPTHFSGDAGRMRQVLTNLIGNAVKFTQQGHVLIRVTGMPGETDTEDLVHVSVEDTGIGIPSDKIDHIFGEFNQADEERSREFEGTGLGLAISKTLVELMGGDIWVTSEEGVGSCFGFRAVLGAANDQALSDDPIEPMGLAIIVCKDSDDTGILTRQLAQVGLDAIVVPSIDHLEEALSDDVNVVLTDHFVSSESGLDVRKLIASLEPSPALVQIGDAMLLASDVERDASVQAVMPRPATRQMVKACFAKLDLPKPVVSENTDSFVFKSRQNKAGEGEHAAIPALEQTKEEAIEAQPPELRQMRVLTAEDNKTNQLVFRKMVKKLNIDLMFANNGEEAVEYQQSFSPDLIFMDISMPKMDGKEATRAIREIDARTGEHTPIVALTAHALTGDDETILAAGLDQYLTKPLKLKEIQTTIEAYQPPDTLPLSEDVTEVQLQASG